MSNKFNILKKKYRYDIKKSQCFCVLSGMKIGSKEDLSIEHYVPRAFGSYELTNSTKNIFPAIKIINNIKGSILPCVWENEKFDMLYHAVLNYRLSEHDYNLVIQAMDNIKYYRINPCHYCVLQKTCQDCR